MKHSAGKKWKEKLKDWLLGKPIETPEEAMQWSRQTENRTGVAMPQSLREKIISRYEKRKKMPDIHDFSFLVLHESTEAVLAEFPNDFGNPAAERFLMTEVRRRYREAEDKGYTERVDNVTQLTSAGVEWMMSQSDK